MKRALMITAAVAILIAGVLALVQPSVRAQLFPGEKVRGRFVFDTGAVECISRDIPPGWSTYYYTWPNSTGQTLRLKASQVWIGVDWNATADIIAQVYVVNAQNQLTDAVNTVGWDRYANPTALHHDFRSLSPDYIEVPPGGGLWMSVGCATKVDVFGNPIPATHGHVQVWAWYSEG